METFTGAASCSNGATKRVLKSSCTPTGRPLIHPYSLYWKANSDCGLKDPGKVETGKKSDFISILVKIGSLDDPNKLQLILNSPIKKKGLLLYLRHRTSKEIRVLEYGFLTATNCLWISAHEVMDGVCCGNLPASLLAAEGRAALRDVFVADDFEVGSAYDAGVVHGPAVISSAVPWRVRDDAEAGHVDAVCAFYPRDNAMCSCHRGNQGKGGKEKNVSGADIHWRGQLRMCRCGRGAEQNLAEAVASLES